MKTAITPVTFHPSPRAPAGNILNKSGVQVMLSTGMAISDANF